MILKDRSRKIIWYSMSVLFVISVYLCVHMNARLFLAPYAKLTDLIWNIHFEYNSNAGYISADGISAVTPYCSGAKMFSALFLIAAVGFPPPCLELKNSIKAFLSYALKISALTFVLNFIRISLSLKLNYLSNATLAHNILSLIIFFGAAFLLFSFLNRKRSVIYEE